MEDTSLRTSSHNNRTINSIARLVNVDFENDPTEDNGSSGNSDSDSHSHTSSHSHTTYRNVNINVLGNSNANTNTNACKEKDKEAETDLTYRAVHQIRLSALIHNYNLVEAAAAQQMCNVIVVVKADGYGHGAIRTALHMADKGADAFAVATLEEAILLRKALDATSKRRKQSPAATVARNVQVTTDLHLSTIFQPPSQQQSSIDETDAISIALSTTSVSGSTKSSGNTVNASRRASVIRILVLGPPVGFPLCFDDYCHYSIECMVSGPEVAAALMQWVANPLDHKRRLVERVAQETKNEIGDSKYIHDDAENVVITVKNSATLSGITGKDLVKEYKQFVLNQKKAAEFKPSASISTNSQMASSLFPDSTTQPTAHNDQLQEQHQLSSHGGFSGIEAAALSSRNREKAAARPPHLSEPERDRSFTVASRHNSDASNASAPGKAAPAKKRRLRWHAVVDTGMGRIGFKTEYPTSPSERDTVEIIQELVNAELHDGATLEFFGMCTHMADAASASTYTHEQIGRFHSLLKRVRDAGISVPTVSTDNSAALLTKSLTHFDPHALLSQPGLSTRGFVRIGGAIYGQRPAFPQFQSVSTLRAAVRHVAILKEGESVGYERVFIAPYNVRIATLAIGFADGYPRELGNGRGHVAIRSKLYPVAGTVCMDMMMIMVGPAEEDSDVRVGDSAILWGGDDGVPLKDVAARLGTTLSALTCGLNKSRILREYVP